MPYCPLGHPTPYGATTCPECGTPVEEPGEPVRPARSGGAEAGPADRIAYLASGLRRGGHFLEIVAVGAAVLGIGAGVIMMLYTDEFDESRPLLGFGLAVALSSIVAGVFNWCVARALHLFAEYAAQSVDVDLDDL